MHNLFRDEKFTDFYVCDHDAKMEVWVNGSHQGLCKRFSEVNSQSDWTLLGKDNIPSGIQNIIDATLEVHKASFRASASLSGFFGSWNDFASSRYRYRESSFNVGKSIAILSKIGDGKDQYTGRPVKIAQLFVPDADFFNNSKQQWSKMEIKAAEELVGIEGSLLISDSKRLAQLARNYQPIELGMSVGAHIPGSAPPLHSPTMQSSPTMHAVYAKSSFSSSSRKQTKNQAEGKGSLNQTDSKYASVYRSPPPNKQIKNQVQGTGSRLTPRTGDNTHTSKDETPVPRPDAYWGKFHS